jgi:hypothetical protein
MPNSDDEKGGCFVALLIFAVIPVILMWEAFVLTRLWGWFVVPFGIMAIGKAHAYGLVLLVSMFKGHIPSKDDEEKGIYYTFFKLLIYGFGAPLVILIIGAITSDLMR